MAGIIVLSGFEAASNADILANTRLQTVPSGGYLTFECQASDNNATDRYTTTIQLPNGNTPLELVQVPMGRTAGLGGQLDSDMKMMATFPVQQGGHCVFSCAETGDAEFTWRVTYTPARR